MARSRRQPASRMKTSLIERYAVSRTTIRQTIQNLTQRGLVEIRRGKGTFVLRAQNHPGADGIERLCRRHAGAGPPATARVLDKQIVAASESWPAISRYCTARPWCGFSASAWRMASLSFDETYLPREIGEKDHGERSGNRTDLLACSSKSTALPLVEAEYRLEAVSRRRHGGASPRHRARQPDISDRANLLLRRASSQSITRSFITGATRSIRDPTGTALTPGAGRRAVPAEMDIGFALWLFAVSLGASALGGMLGMASGIFIVPILTIFGHIDIHTAIGASIVSVIACSCGSAAPFLRGTPDQHPARHRAGNRDHAGRALRRASLLA